MIMVYFAVCCTCLSSATSSLLPSGQCHGPRIAEMSAAASRNSFITYVQKYDQLAPECCAISTIIYCIAQTYQTIALLHTFCALPKLQLEKQVNVPRGTLIPISENVA